MLEFIVWLIMYALLMAGLMLGIYWYELMRSGDSYSRAELLELGVILPAQARRLLQPAANIPGAVALAAGTALAWALIFFGGLVSPNVLSVPDFAEGHMPNYFFQSILLPVILLLVWPSLRDLVETSAGGRSGLLYRFLEGRAAFFCGLCLSLAATNLAVWGVHHRFSFLYSLFNTLAGTGIAAYCFYRDKVDRNEAFAQDVQDEFPEATPVEEENSLPVDDLNDSDEFNQY